MSLRTTAANLSRVRRSGIPKKSPLSPLKPKVTKKTASKKTNTHGDQEKLIITNHNVQLDFRLPDASSVVDAMETVTSNQWAETSAFHTRHFSREAKANASNAQDLLFSLRGIAMTVKADILKYRAQQLPSSGMLTVNQLYSMFDNRGNTYVDRSLELCIRNGLVKKFIISNALPVILNTISGYNPKVTYGYENTEIVVKTEQYLALIDENTAQCSDDEVNAFSKFRDYVEANPESLFVTNEEFTAPELSLLVKTGFLTLTSNHHNEIDVHQYSISFPKCGTFLKMINAGRAWLVKTLGKAKYKEFLEEVLFDKWEGKNLANFRKPFYGYDLLWILAEAQGAGIVEAFDTPVGRGWRLTGKL